MHQRLMIGCMVHYCMARLDNQQEAVHVPFLVVETTGETISGWAFGNPHFSPGRFWVGKVPFSDEYQPRTWHWVERFP